MPRSGSRVRVSFPAPLFSADARRRFPIGIAVELDPVADKLIVSTALVLLVQADPNATLAVVAAIIIGREITVSALREWMSQIGARAHVAVSIFGKWKTTLQIIGISFMLYREPLLTLPTYRIGEWLVYVAAALTIWSMIDYLRAAGPALRAEG